MRTAVSNVLTTVRNCATVSIALTFTLILVYTCKLYAYINSCVNSCKRFVLRLCVTHSCKESSVTAVRRALIAAIYIYTFAAVSSTLAAMVQDPETVTTVDAAVVTAQLISQGVQNL